MEHKHALDDIKQLLLFGSISYDEAKRRAAPHIAAMNTKAAEIAKRHGVRPRLVNFASFMR
jgi:hypothetical protein